MPNSGSWVLPIAESGGMTVAPPGTDDNEFLQYGVRCGLRRCFLRRTLGNGLGRREQQPRYGNVNHTHTNKSN